MSNVLAPTACGVADAGAGGPAALPGRGLVRALSLGVALIGAWALFGVAAPVASAATDVCPNAAIRAQQQAESLPDCRAWEQVSAVDKLGRDVFGIVVGAAQYATATSADGTAASFGAGGAFGDSASGPLVVDYAARRGAEGWSVHSLAVKGYGAGLRANVLGWSEDLSEAVLGSDGDDLADGATPGASNMYRVGVRSGVFGALTLDPGLGPQSSSGDVLRYMGASSDMSTIVFDDSVRHTLDAPASVTNSYEWRDGHMSLVSVLPDPDGSGPLTGQPAPDGAVVGAIPANGAFGYADNAVSRDGSRIFFTTPDGRLYVRVDGQRTVEVSASHKAVPNAQQPATYKTATPDGSQVFFLTSEQLVDSDTDSVADLYRYDVDTGQLTRISVGATNPENLGVWYVAGASDDGSYVYFTGVVANYGGVVPDGATPFEFYMWHDGEIKYVGDAGFPVNGGGPSDVNMGSVQVSPDGTKVVFQTVAPQPLAGSFDPQGQAQAYLYDATSSTLRCVSCRSDGGSPGVPPYVPSMGAGPLPIGRDGDAFGDYPGGIRTSALSADGRRVFFTSPDPLVPADTNGKLDAYEFEDGQVHLLSSGRDPDDSLFVNATLDGRTAFFTTRQRLVGSDGDGNVDLYAARTDGGFSAPVFPGECVEDGCQGSPGVSPSIASAATVTFAGAGDALVPSAGSVAGKVTVTRLNVVRGSSASLTVRVPGAGQIRASGSGLIGLSRASSKAGSYRVSVRLSARAKRTLALKHRVVVLVTVQFVPKTGKAQSVRMPVTFQPVTKAKGRAGRVSASSSRSSMKGGR